MVYKVVDGAGKRQAKDVRQAEFAADVLFPLDRRKANSEQVKSKWRANKKQMQLPQKANKKQAEGK